MCPRAAPVDGLLVHGSLPEDGCPAIGGACHLHVRRCLEGDLFEEGRAAVRLVARRIDGGHGVGERPLSRCHIDVGGRGRLADLRLVAIDVVGTGSARSRGCPRQAYASVIHDGLQSARSTGAAVITSIEHLHAAVRGVEETVEVCVCARLFVPVIAELAIEVVALRLCAGRRAARQRTHDAVAAVEERCTRRTHLGHTVAIVGLGKDGVPVGIRRTFQATLAVERSRGQGAGIGRDLHVVALRVMERDAPGRGLLAAIPAVIVDVVILRDALPEQQQESVRSAVGRRGGQAGAAHHAARGRRLPVAAAGAVRLMEDELPLAQLLVGSLDACGILSAMGGGEDVGLQVLSRIVQQGAGADVAAVVDPLDHLADAPLLVLPGVALGAVHVHLARGRCSSELRPLSPRTVALGQVVAIPHGLDLQSWLTAVRARSVFQRDGIARDETRGEASAVGVGGVGIGPQQLRFVLII